jgi:hypothetical protein
MQLAGLLVKCGLEIIWGGKNGRGLFHVLSRNFLGTERNISVYTLVAPQIQTRHFIITSPEFYNYECRTESTAINLNSTSPIRQNYSTLKPETAI